MQTVERLAELSLKKSKFACHTVALSAGNRDTALASSVPAVVAVKEEFEIHG